MGAGRVLKKKWCCASIRKHCKRMLQVRGLGKKMVGNLHKRGWGGESMEPDYAEDILKKGTQKREGLSFWQGTARRGSKGASLNLARA